MAESLKDAYLSPAFFETLSKDLKKAYPALKRQQFYSDCVKPLEELELKQRITHLTEVTAKHLPAPYPKALTVLYDLAEILNNNTLGYLFLPEFVSRFGQDYYELSINALRDFTHLSSSEFAVRDFLNKDFSRTIKVMQSWCQHEDEHIRRLASEGSRPRLPWSCQLPQVIAKPTLTWSILNTLKNDDSKYVQKSVANHLNDISKDHADWLINKISKWNKNKQNTAWIIKHGCRSLIKQGHKETLLLFDVVKANVEVENFTLNTDTVYLGNKLAFNFQIKSTSNTTQNIIVDYKVHFLKKNGQHSAKVFKLKSFSLAAKEGLDISKNHLFKNLTTRVHYPGEHKIELMINGQSYKILTFILDMNK